ncbi:MULTISPECIES: ATP-binding protein [unclassified Lysobacter]|uniref:ATP-binding protein n=1 Tax=unclassified Lysobacter TaxID=2635362 RepID=UPI001BEA58D3|nr:MULTISPECIES: ATP-binding protein [unclassified Lysobacter]MBT2748108.1 HAMP domain-containing protein [Lysobacter sp. ISL-42]MBT2754148.1 HAMP domain-containing protein [Lysobacter sp. ISL-50]MBT2776026.1 HAMP domain-containing protein [Lysobacter sp. ISL-54]MBT2784135.1 HAMP domain-containing protein [Lysobacter sp. ISL-52]
MLSMLVRLYLTVAGLLLCSILVVQQVFPYLFPDQYSESARHEFVGELALLRDRLGGASGRDLALRLAALNRETPERYSLMPAPQVAALPRRVRDDLLAGGTASDHGSSEHHHIYLRLAGGEVVQIGYNENDFPIRYIAYLTVFAMVLLGLMMWLQPHWRDLERLRETAAQFGDGDLGARARLRGGSSIRQLCAYFNNMADQIGRLIQSQRDMVNAASHELRTPITRLEFGLANLADTLDDRVARARVHALRCDVEELDLLVGELLTLGMLERNGPEPTLEPVELSAFLRASTGVSAEELRIRSATIEWAISPALDEVNVEPRSLRRAFSNLMRNAVRYADNVIRVAAELDGEDWLLIVEDDGVGIPPEDRRRVFEPFYRLDRSRDRSTGGFGLGLSIVRQVIERHGGAIHVESSALGGARLVARLPRQPGLWPSRRRAGNEDLDELDHSFHIQ